MVNKPIYLTGYMGCGKTTLGEAVARDASLTLIDLDSYIERKAGNLSVSEIFSRLGEAQFRRMELEALDEVSRMTRVIVATGGGTPCRPGVPQMLINTGLVVHLTTSIDTLVRRLIEGKAKRPLIARLDDCDVRQFVLRNMRERQPYYDQCHAKFDSTLLEDATQISQSSASFIEQFITNNYHDR